MSDKVRVDGQIPLIHRGTKEGDPFFHATSTAKQYRVAMAAPAKRQQQAQEELAKRESEYSWLRPHASAAFWTALVLVIVGSAVSTFGSLGSILSINWMLTSSTWLWMMWWQYYLMCLPFLYGVIYGFELRSFLRPMWAAQAKLKTAAVVRKAEREFTQNELCGYCERANQAARSVNQLIEEFNLYVAASRTKHTGVVTRADEDELRTWLTRMRDEVEEHLRSADVQVQIFDFKAWRQKAKIPEASFALEDLREAADRMRVLDDVDPAKALEGVDSVRKLDALEKELADRTGSVHAAIAQARARTGQ